MRVANMATAFTKQCGRHRHHGTLYGDNVECFTISATGKSFHRIVCDSGEGMAIRSEGEQFGQHKKREMPLPRHGSKSLGEQEFLTRQCGQTVDPPPSRIQSSQGD